jgi:hypothetical protein
MTPPEAMLADPTLHPRDAAMPSSPVTKKPSAKSDGETTVIASNDLKRTKCGARPTKL